jgi:CheY-like chemotaxis protein
MAADNDDTADTGWSPEDGDEPQETAGESEIRVLHVDDRHDVVEMNRRYLEQYDDRIELESARNAADGLDRLAAEEFDCIVSDYEMPGMNGLEFLERIRENNTELPFVLYTTRPLTDIVSEGVPDGVTDYLRKERGQSHLEMLGKKIVVAVESR